MAAPAERLWRRTQERVPPSGARHPGSPRTHARLGPPLTMQRWSHFQHGRPRRRGGTGPRRRAPTVWARLVESSTVRLVSARERPHPRQQIWPLDARKLGAAATRNPFVIRDWRRFRRSRNVTRSNGPGPPIGRMWRGGATMPRSLRKAGSPRHPKMPWYTTAAADGRPAYPDERLSSTLRRESTDCTLRPLQSTK